MLIKPVSVTQLIELTEAESITFKKLFPSSRDIEAFVEDIIEDGESIAVQTEEKNVIFTVELSSATFLFYGDVRSEMNRISSQIQQALLSYEDSGN